MGFSARRSSLLSLNAPGPSLASPPADAYAADGTLEHAAVRDQQTPLRASTSFDQHGRRRPLLHSADRGLMEAIVAVHPPSGEAYPEVQVKNCDSEAPAIR